MKFNQAKTLTQIVTTCAIFPLAACSMSTTASLYPVQGPLSQSGSKSAIIAKVGGITGGSGPFDLTMPNGAKCNGKWASVAPTYVQNSNVSLLTQYGSIVGNGTTSGNLPGANKGQAYAVCDDGNALNAEFLTGSGTANGYGVAQDKNGNVFKLLF